MTEGFILFNYQGKEYQTWCKVIGDLYTHPLGLGLWRVRSILAEILVSSIATPGQSHNYLLPRSDLVSEVSIPASSMNRKLPFHMSPIEAIVILDY